VSSFRGPRRWAAALVVAVGAPYPGAAQTPPARAGQGSADAPPNWGATYYRLSVTGALAGPPGPAGGAAGADKRRAAARRPGLRGGTPRAAAAARGPALRGARGARRHVPLELVLNQPRPCCGWPRCGRGRAGAPPWSAPARWPSATRGSRRRPRTGAGAPGRAAGALGRAAERGVARGGYAGRGQRGRRSATAATLAHPQPASERWRWAAQPSSARLMYVPLVGLLLVATGLACGRAADRQRIRARRRFSPTELGWWWPPLPSAREFGTSGARRLEVIGRGLTYAGVVAMWYGVLRR
jgi:hypothetical protein